ncbi:MAG: 2-C-methyl-D-erythritol 4-phosphate cytidylyltransferase [Lachnospiraceae bacterium]|nr:2-C-methyl-D-erythritol 4-phosphate cytidylyltransferase [Lachnospiraceae bacterium]
MKDKCTAIVLAAGKGKRMETIVPKQFLLLDGNPLLYYSLKVFEDSFIDDIVIVASEDYRDFIETDIVWKYGITKVRCITEGGRERYDSVLSGLRAADCDYAFIHDGARPFIDAGILKRAYETVKSYGSAIVAMPVKDTIKTVDEKGVAVDTPDRSRLWQMQTPQVFRYKEIREAYETMISFVGDSPVGNRITDDAMVMERFGTLPVHVCEGSYRNIKVTTPEDMLIAKALVKG